MRASRKLKTTIAGLALLAATGGAALAITTPSGSTGPQVRADGITEVVQGVQDVLAPVIGDDMHW